MVGLEEILANRLVPQEGEAVPYSGGGQLLTSTGEIIRRWKEYFEDFLDPTDTSSIEKAEAEDCLVPVRPEQEVGSYCRQ